MPGSQGPIEAGRAFVKLLLDDDEVDSDLAELAGKFEMAAAKLAKTAVKISAFGGMLFAPFAAGLAQMQLAIANLDFSRKRVAMAAQDYLELSGAMKLVGGTAEGFEIAIKSMNERLRQLQTGSGETVAGFQALGINIEKFLGETQRERILMLADAFSQLEDGAVAAGLGLTVAGEGGQQVVPLLRLGREEVERLMKTAAMFSPTAEQLQKSSDFARALSMTRAVISNLAADIAVIVVPPLIKFMSVVSRAAAALREFLQSPIGIGVSRLMAMAAAASLAAGSLVAFAAAMALAAGSAILLFAALGKIAAIMGITASLFSPVGLTIWAIVGAVVALIALTPTLNRFFEGLADFIGQLAPDTLGFVVRMLGYLVKLGSVVVGLFSTDLGNAMRGYGNDLINLGDKWTESGFWGGGTDARPINKLGANNAAMTSAAAMGFSSAGIGGYAASQQTLGLAGIGVATAASNLQSIAESSEEQVSLLKQLKQDAEFSNRFFGN